MAKTFKNSTISFTNQAKEIIDTYSTISDRISLIYAKEFNGSEYGNLPTSNTEFLKIIEFDNDEYLLYVLCSMEDSQENISYILHKYKMINNNYNHVSSKIAKL